MFRTSKYYLLRQEHFPLTFSTSFFPVVYSTRDKSHFIVFGMYTVNLRLNTQLAIKQFELLSETT